MTRTSLSRHSVKRWSTNGILLVAIGASFWGMDSIFIVSLLHHLSSPQIILLEHVILALFAVPVVWKARKSFAGLSWRDWMAVLFIAWGGSAIASILFTAAFNYGNANVVLILQKLQPVFAVLMAQWILKEHLPRSYPLLLVYVLIGTYFLSFGFSIPKHITDARVIAAALAIGAAVLWGGSTVMGRLLLNKLEFRTVTAMRFLCALPLLVVIVSYSSTDWMTMFGHAIQPVVLLNLGLQALLPSLLSLLLYYHGLSKTKASYATIAELAFPATGLLLNWLVLRQGITLGQMVGFAIVWTAVFVLARYSEDGAPQGNFTAVRYSD